MLETTLFTHDAEETGALGACLGRVLLPGDLVALTGELGAGKTCFVQGLARGLEVPEDSYVRSPTFVILNIYPGRFPLHHMDMYRIMDPAELEDIGYREFFFGEGVTVVEWADKIPDLLPDERMSIHLKFQGETGRELALVAHEGCFQDRWDRLMGSLSRFQKKPDSSSRKII